MTMRIRAARNWDDCQGCEPDFDDFVEIFDAFNGDDAEPELHGWAYAFSIRDGAIRVVLPCGGFVSMLWDRNPGTIIDAGCGP